MAEFQFGVDIILGIKKNIQKNVLSGVANQAKQVDKTFNNVKKSATDISTRMNNVKQSLANRLNYPASELTSTLRKQGIVLTENGSLFDKQKMKAISYFETLNRLKTAVAPKTESATGVVGTNKGLANVMKTESVIAKKLNIDMKYLSDAFKKNGLVVEKNGKIFDKQQLKYLNFDRAVQKVNKSTKKMDFGFLSLIFGGQALTRTFGTMFRSLYTGYKELAGDNSEFLKTTDKLGGAFNYLKFTIFDAFANNEFVKKFADFLTKFLVNLGNFFNDHPKISAAIVTLTIALAGLGLVLTGIGQGITLGKAISEIGSLYTFLKTSAIVTKIRGLVSSLGNLNGALTGLSLIAGIGLSIYWATDAFKMLKDPASTLMDYLKTTALGGVAGFLIGFSLGGLPGGLTGFLVGISAGVVISIIDWYIQKKKKISKDDFDITPDDETLNAFGINKEEFNYDLVPDMEKLNAPQKLDKIIPTVDELKIQEQEDLLESYKQHISELNLAEIFMEIDLDDFDDFKELLKNTLKPTQKLTSAFIGTDEKDGLLTALYNTGLASDSLVDKSGNLIDKLDEERVSVNLLKDSYEALNDAMYGRQGNSTSYGFSPTAN